MCLALVAAVIPLLAPAATAQLRLPLVLSDGAVLQRDHPIPVWGWAAPDATVTVRFGHARTTTEADARGLWRVELPAMAAGGPFALEVASGEESARADDVLIGDVWVLSGQSNMEWPVRDARDAEAEIASADDAQIRHFAVPHTTAESPADELMGGAWAVASPQTVGGFSAVGYFFARDLRPHVDVPIGLIHASWSGSRIEPWMSSEMLGYGPAQASGEGLRQRPPEVSRARAEATGAAPAARGPAQTPMLLWNGMVAPLAQSPAAGVLWYQGESNGDRMEDAVEYGGLFRSMIAGWRAAWGQPDLPFLWVQLAGYHAPPRDAEDTGIWPTVRAGQSNALALANTAEALALDVGDADDIHPTDKQTVGHRLALAARRLVYGETDLVASGPRYRSHDVRDGRIEIAFEHTGGGLATRDDAALGGFTLADASGAWHSATARIDGDRVVVSSPAAPVPVGIRYAWADNPVAATLENAEGLPAAPFEIR